MRVLAFIISVTAATVVSFGGIVLVVFATPSGERRDPLPIILAVIAQTIFVYGPLTLGSVSAYWNTRKTADARRYFRRCSTVVVGLDVLGAVAIVSYASLTGTPAWVPTLFIAVAAVLLAAALLIGPRLLAIDEKNSRDAGAEPWRPVEHREIMRKVLKICATFVVALVVTAIVLGVVLPSIGSASTADVGRVVLLCLGFSFLAATFAAIIVSFSYSRMLRTTTDRDLGLARKLGKLVLRAKPVELNPGEEVAAAKYAGVMALVLKFQISYIVLLYLGLLLNQLQTLLEGSSSGFTFVLAPFLVAVLIVFLPLQVIRIRRAERYAREHAHLLTEAAPDATAQPAAAKDPATP